MIWNIIFQNLKNQKKTNFSFLGSKNLNLTQKKNILKILKTFNQKNKIETLKSLVNNNFLNKLKKKKTNYKNFIYKKVNLKNKQTNFIKKLILISLNKKQTVCNINHKYKNIFFSTNGIILKENDISEKKRKKEIKFTIINITKTLNKNTLDNTTVNIRKIKPFLTKIIKIIKNFFKKNENKLNLIVSPKIPFNKINYKKVKSIKRRLRKKFNLLDF